MTSSDILKQCRKFGIPWVTVKAHPKNKACINPVLIQCLINAIVNDGFISKDGRCIKLKRSELLRRIKKYESTF